MEGGGAWENVREGKRKLIEDEKHCVFDEMKKLKDRDSREKDGGRLLCYVYVGWLLRRLFSPWPKKRPWPDQDAAADQVAAVKSP